MTVGILERQNAAYRRVGPMMAILVALVPVEYAFELCDTAHGVGYCKIIITDDAAYFNKLMESKR